MLRNDQIDEEQKVSFGCGFLCRATRTFNNRVLRLPAIVLHLLHTTFRPGNSGLLRVYEFQGRNVVFNKTIAGRWRTLLLNVKSARMSVKTQTFFEVRHDLNKTLGSLHEKQKFIKSAQTYKLDFSQFLAIVLLFSVKFIANLCYSPGPPQQLDLSYIIKPFYFFYGAPTVSR